MRAAADLKLLFGKQLLGLVGVLDVRRGQRLVEHFDKRRCGISGVRCALMTLMDAASLNNNTDNHNSINVTIAHILRG